MSSMTTVVDFLITDVDGCFDVDACPCFVFTFFFGSGFGSVLSQLLFVAVLGLGL